MIQRESSGFIVKVYIDIDTATGIGDIKRLPTFNIHSGAAVLPCILAGTSAQHSIKDYSLIRVHVTDQHSGWYALCVAYTIINMSTTKYFNLEAEIFWTWEQNSHLDSK